jgi:hypothetical protein
MSTRAHLNLESIFFFEALEYGAGLLKKNFNKIYFSRKFWVLSLFFLRDGSFFIVYTRVPWYYIIFFANVQYE